LYFAFDDAVNKTVVTVVDRHTDKVVRQIPNEVALSLAARLNEEEPLRLFSAQA
jgi:flagellar protein FlaG